MQDGVKLLCINATGQKILGHNKVYTVYNPLGVHTPDGKVYVQEHKRFAFLLTRFKVIQ